MALPRYISIRLMENKGTKEQRNQWLHLHVMSLPVVSSGTFLNLILAWISNDTHYKVWDEITNPFPNFNGATVEV